MSRWRKTVRNRWDDALSRVDWRDFERLLADPSPAARADTAAKVARAYSAPSLSDAERQLAQAIVAAQAFENNMLKAYIRDWPSDSEEAASS